MRLTLATDLGDLSSVELPPSATLRDLQAAAARAFPRLAASAAHPASASQNGATGAVELPRVYASGVDLVAAHGAAKAVKDAGIASDDVMLVRPAPVAIQPAAGRASSRAFPGAVGGSSAPAAGAGGAVQPQQMQAAVGQFLQAMQSMLNDPQQRAQLEQQAEQQKRQRAIDENMHLAMEETPEAFGRVIMLYINCAVNGHKIKAFVDSGAQMTILSETLAKQVGLDHLIDPRFAGVAQGVGTAKILGRVHAAQLQVGPPERPVFLMCSFTVMEGTNNGVDMLLGLDMLKRHQAILDLERNELRIQGCSISFLPEHELPEQAKDRVKEAKAVAEAEQAAAVAASQQSQQAGASGSQQGALSSPPASVAGPAPVAAPARAAPAPASPAAAAAAQPAAPAAVSSAAVDQLISMGVPRDQAVQALVMAGGNVDLAASLLFN